MGKAEGTALLIQEGYQLSCWRFLPKNCMKMKAGEIFHKTPQCMPPEGGFLTTVNLALYYRMTYRTTEN